MSDYTPHEGEICSAYVRDSATIIVKDGTLTNANVEKAHAEARRGIAKVKADALREAADMAITIPDVLGYKVDAVAVEDLLDRADRVEEES